MGIIRDDRSRKGHFKQESKVCAGIYKWGTVFFKSMRYIVERKHITNSVTYIEKTWEGGDNVAIKLWFNIALVFFITTVYNIRYNYTPYIPAIICLRCQLKETSSISINMVH
jgi:hypothetical protein